MAWCCEGHRWREQSVALCVGYRVAARSVPSLEYVSIFSGCAVCALVASTSFGVYSMFGVGTAGWGELSAPSAVSCVTVLIRVLGGCACVWRYKGLNLPESEVHTRCAVEGLWCGPPTRQWLFPPGLMSLRNKAASVWWGGMAAFSREAHRSSCVSSTEAELRDRNRPMDYNHKMVGCRTCCRLWSLS